MKRSFVSPVVFLLLFLVPSVCAVTYDVTRGVPSRLETTCVYNGVLYAENATVELWGAGNVTVLNETGMNQFSPGVFDLPYTFAETGYYTTIENCVFPNGTVVQTSNAYVVGESWYALLLPGLGVLLLVFGFRNRTFLFFSGICFLLTVIITLPSILFSVLFLLLGVGLMYQAAHLK